MQNLQLVRIVPQTKIAQDYYSDYNILSINGILYKEDDVVFYVISGLKFKDGALSYLDDMTFHKSEFDYVVECK